MSFLDGGGNYSDTSATANYGTTYGNNPPEVMYSDYSDNFAPGNVTNGAVNWTDVLKYGIGRIADNQNQSITPQNARPQYAAQPVYQQNQGGGSGLLLIGLGVVLFLALSGD